MSCSVLIHACATVGRWEEAEKIFAEQLEAAKSDEECKPNRITYRWAGHTSEDSSKLVLCRQHCRIPRHQQA